MKKTFSLVVTIIALITLTACINNNYSIKDTTPDIDLSAYDKYGNWSCGRIWVQKTEKSWDSSQTYIGYLNEQGNLVGTWHSTTAWELPTDFENNFAFVGTGAYDFSWNTATLVNYDVINLAGEIVFKLECIAGPDGYSEAAITKFNEYGYAFCIEGYYEDTYVKAGKAFILCQDGKKIALDERLVLNRHNLNKFAGYFSEGYMAYSNEAYINEQGEVVLDFSDRLESYLDARYTITSLYPVENGLAKVVFEGMDEERYFIVLDTYGNLLTKQPIPYNQFNAFDFDTLERVDNNRKSNISKDDFRVGATIRFGNYEQDNITANGSELIEWIVLSVDKEKALLVSKYVLDSCEYATEYYQESITWENSKIRSWLNESLYSTIFNEEEKQYILPTAIDSKVITYVGVYNGKELREDIASRDVTTVSTTDFVFLLSVDEIKTLMSANEIAGIGTKYCKEKVDGVRYVGNSQYYYQWMTRDFFAHKSFSGNYSKQVLSFEGNGTEIHNYASWEDFYNHYNINGVRPAIYIDFKKFS